jgi:crotonobetainyl-CoA:carnitine CoA-transferase CaiB-like acyl-CoA transferase
MSVPLEGLLVVSIEQAVAAPMCTLRLADSGARVIKIERAEGDTARHYDRTVHGTSAYFAWLNRGKQSIVLDLKAAPDFALVRMMLSRADIFVQNLLPGAAARLGLGSIELAERYPLLIAVDIAGYGKDTPYSAMRAYDMLVQAESGLCSVTGTPDVPSKVGVSIADICTGMNAHAAILEALFERERTGRGRSIEVTMFDGLAEWMTVPLLQYEHSGRVTPRVGLSHAQIYPYGSFRCSDGNVVIAIQNAGEWCRFCTGILKRPELISDSRFVDNPARLANRTSLDEIIQSEFALLACAELIANLEHNQLAWARCSTVPDLSKHPALRRTSVRAPGGAEFAAVASPLRVLLEGKAVPGLGEHSEQIRAEFTAIDKKELE